MARVKESSTVGGRIPSAKHRGTLVGTKVEVRKRMFMGSLS